MANMCPACGYDGLELPPRAADGSGSYEICPSCSFQFGVTDSDQGVSYQDWRTEWKRRGMIWDRGMTAPPKGWDPAAQLRRVEAHSEA